MSARLAAFVEALGVAGPFGATTGELLAALSGSSVAGKVETFPVPGGGEVRGMRTDLQPLERFLPKRSLRRVDRYSRLALLGAHLALEEAGLEKPLGDKLGLVIATGWGASGSSFSFLDSIIDDGDALASPTHFSASVHNAAAAYVSMTLGITGPNFTTSLFAGAVTSGLATALHLLEAGLAERVLLGCLDEFSPPYGFGLDRGGEPSLHSEGAAFFLLTSDEAGSRYGRLAFAPGKGGPGAETEPVLGRFPSRAGLDLAAAVAAGEGSALVREEGGEGAILVRGS